jgi:hypothetical protein
MALVAATKGAQFTPAGVLRLPLDGVDSSARILAALKEHMAALQA